MELKQGVQLVWSKVKKNKINASTNTSKAASVLAIFRPDLQNLRPKPKTRGYIFALIHPLVT